MQILKLANGWLVQGGSVADPIYYPSLLAVAAVLEPQAANDSAFLPPTAPASNVVPLAAPRRGRPPKATTESPPAANDAASQEHAKAPAPVGDTLPGKTFDDVKAAIALLNGTKGLSAVKNALSRVGASKLSEIKPEAYAEFVKICESGTPEVSGAGA